MPQISTNDRDVDTNIIVVGDAQQLLKIVIREPIADDHRGYAKIKIWYSKFKINVRCPQGPERLIICRQARVVVIWLRANLESANGRRWSGQDETEKKEPSKIAKNRTSSRGH